MTKLWILMVVLGGLYNCKPNEAVDRRSSTNSLPATDAQENEVLDLEFKDDRNLFQTEKLSEVPVVSLTPTVSSASDKTILEDRKVDGARPVDLLFNTVQLKNQIKCVSGDPEITKIAEASIIQLQDDDSDSEEKSDAFLLPTLFTAGEDIIDINKSLFDGPDYLTQTGVRLNFTNLDYLVALGNVANVVAHNCEIKNKENQLVGGECACSTQSLALELVNSCLGILGLTDSTKEIIARDLAEICESDSKAAIASLIASWAFVRSP